MNFGRTLGEVRGWVGVINMKSMTLSEIKIDYF